MFQLKCFTAKEAIFPFEPPDFPTSFRKEQWLSSRYALLKSLNEIRPDLKINSEQDLQIENHQYLTGHPDILVSISHTKERGAALVYVSKDNSILGIGVDIEYTERLIKKQVTKYYFHGKDNFELEEFPKDLALWSAKESAFKAISPFWERDKVFVLKDIWVDNKEFGIDDEVLGDLIYEQYSSDLLVTQAHLRKLPKL